MLFKKFFLATLLAAVLCQGTLGQAEQPFVENVGGVGYQQSLVYPSMTPYIILTTVAAIAIVAVAIRHTSGHGHSHSH